MRIGLRDIKDFFLVKVNPFHKLPSHHYRAKSKTELLDRMIEDLGAQHINTLHPSQRPLARALKEQRVVAKEKHVNKLQRADVLKTAEQAKTLVGTVAKVAGVSLAGPAYHVVVHGAAIAVAATTEKDAKRAERISVETMKAIKATGMMLLMAGVTHVYNSVLSSATK